MYKGLGEILYIHTFSAVYIYSLDKFFFFFYNMSIYARFWE